MSSLLVHVVTLLVSSALALDEDTAELAAMLRDECAEETGVDDALLQKMDTGVSLEPDPKLKCYIKCIMELTGMMTDGIVDVDVVLALLPGDMGIRNAVPVTACGTQSGVDDCDTAFLTQLCWQNANKEDFFFL